MADGFAVVAGQVVSDVSQDEVVMLEDFIFDDFNLNWHTVSAAD